MNNQINEIIPKPLTSQPSSRKSRSISRYFLGTKRSSIDDTIQTNAIHRCLISVGIFDTYDLSTHVTLFRDYTTYQRLFILTNKNELIIGKSNQRQYLFKLKQRIDLNRIWLYTNLNDYIVSEITSLNYYDSNRSLIIGWPLAENFLVEFETKSIRDTWKERIESTLRFWWQLNDLNLEHVRIVIDQNYESDQNTTSFLIRKVISIRPEETVRDLIKKCIDAFHLQDPLVENYILFVKNNQTNGITPTNSTSQTLQITNIPLIGHEYPYSIKMKHLKLANRSFDGDEHPSLQNQYNSSSTSLNNVPTTNYHDFELRKRDTLTDHQTKKYRFFHKRKTKSHQQISDDYHSSSTPYLSSPNPTKIYFNFFGQKLDDLIRRYNQQLPPVIMQLLEILYLKGPETTGIFRKVANARSVKDCIEKIERNISLQEEDLHPILAAGILKHFIRTLPEPLFNSIQYDNWKKCLRFSILTEKLICAKKNILSTLSKGNYLLLKGFICILHHISEYADTNGMNPFNLGLCVSNSLFKTESTTIISGKQEADVMSSIVEFLIQNCSILFGSDIFTCITDKHILIHPIANLAYPTASSIESLDEVESSPHIPLVNRSHDSGLAASDQPFNDDSSEVSEHFRRHQSSIPDWTSSIASGKGIVLTSIITNSTISVTRRRSSKNNYKPSKQFLEREKFRNNTTDDEDKTSSRRSSTTTIHNINTGKIKRSKSLSRHSSLNSGESKHQQKQIIKESRRLIITDVKRSSSLKQIHYSSDEGGEEEEDDDDDEQNKRRNKLIKSKININEECIITSSTQDLDLTTESLNEINQRLSNPSIPIRSTSFSLTKHSQISPTRNINRYQEPIIADNRSRHHTPLIPTTNQMFLRTQLNSRFQHRGQSNLNTQKTFSTERDRTFVHHSDSRPFVLSAAIQMKPMDDKRHRQNLLKYQSNEQERQSRVSTPILTNISRYQSIERRITPPPMKSFSFDINDELHPSDISLSVREKAKLFEHKLSTGRENYV